MDFREARSSRSALELACAGVARWVGEQSTRGWASKVFTQLYTHREMGTACWWNDALPVHLHSTPAPTPSSVVFIMHVKLTLTLAPVHNQPMLCTLPASSTAAWLDASGGELGEGIHSLAHHCPWVPAASQTRHMTLTAHPCRHVLSSAPASWQARMALTASC